jgi:hypothetical protein
MLIALLMGRRAPVDLSRATGASSTSVARNWETAERFFRSLTARQRVINDQSGRSRGGAADADIPARLSRSPPLPEMKSSDCFRNPERRGERCHHRLRLRQLHSAAKAFERAARSIDA